MKPSASLLILLLSSSVLEAQEGDTRFRAAPPTQIHGTIVVRGCVPEASDLDLRAVPLNVATTRRDKAHFEATASDISARVEGTLDPHAFSFVIRGLHPATLYQLSFFTPPNPVCPRVFWRNATQGFAVSGGEPVLIEGVAATTALEVRQPGTDEWVGADPLDFTNSVASTRQLRWRSRVPNVIGGELQISTSIFPTRGDFGACDEPAGGVLYRQQVPAGDAEWGGIEPLNFHALLARRLEGGSLATETTLKMLLIGAPIYARVIPLTPDGPACDTREHGVPGWVVFAKIPTDPLPDPEPSPAPILEAGGGHVYEPPSFLHWGYGSRLAPTYSEWGYRVVKPHPLPTADICSVSATTKLQQLGVPHVLIPAYGDPFGCLLAKAGFAGHLNVGFRFAVQKTYSTGSGGGGFFDIALNLVTTGVNALGVGVNAGAAVYNAAVDAAKNLAYEFVMATPGLGQLCDGFDEECKKGIEIGMTYGMASMGLPPSVPNWDELKEEGADYLAALAGEYIEAYVGVPSPLTEEVLKELAHRAIDDMNGKRGGSLPQTSWLVGDAGFTPPSWTAAVRKNGVEPLDKDVALFVEQTALLAGRKVPLPHKFPLPTVFGLGHSTLRVPIVLRPNVNDVLPPICRSTFPTYTKGPPQQCYPNGFATPGSKPICQYQTNTGPSSPWKIDEDCSSYGDLVAIYYRNAWAAKLAHTTATTNCMPLHGITLARDPFLSFFSSYEVWPNLTFPMSAFVPPFLRETWNGAFINLCP